MLDGDLEESLGNHRFSSWSKNQRYDPSEAIKKIWTLTAYFVKMTSFQRLGLYQSLYSLQWWLTQWSLPSSTTMMAEICLYIVISLIVLCYYCKNQIIKDCCSMMDFEWKPFVETVLRCISTLSGLRCYYYMRYIKCFISWCRLLEYGQWKVIF